MLVRKKGQDKVIDLKINYSYLLSTWHGLFDQVFLESEYMEQLMSFLYLSYEDAESGIMPSNKADIFLPFQTVDFEDCNVIFITEFPTTSNKGSGLGLGNKSSLAPYQVTPEFVQFRKMVEENLYKGNPSLELDVSLNESAENGVLYLNTALTCTKKNNKAHVNHWDKFISYLIKAFDGVTANKAFVFIGGASKFAHLVDQQYNTIIIEENSIDLCCKNKEYWNTNVFKEVNEFLIDNYGLPYHEKAPFI